MAGTLMTALAKAPTGIGGLDEITGGGLPAGRPTLICGGAGSGKTLIGITFLVNGAQLFDEPGVFMSFEERAADLAANFASLGYDLPGLIASRHLVVDHVHVERSEIEESGEYDLEGLFVRIGHAVRQSGARRVVLDTIEALFSGFTDPAILRAELRRLFGWLRERELTTIITGERGDGTLTRHGLEEYVSDCVILLDNRVAEQIATRRLRVVKYRGSAHGSNEYPFLIDSGGISVLPVGGGALLGAPDTVSSDIISTGVAGLDAMLRSGGIYRGSSALISGLPGAGKSTFAAHFAHAACRRGERAMIFLFEEGAAELCRNAASVGLDLTSDIASGLLRIHGSRPALYGLEMHLARMHREIQEISPSVVVVDPISAFSGPAHEVHAALLRMVDMLKAAGITALFTSLSEGEPETGGPGGGGGGGLSSLMDVWIRLNDAEGEGERNRLLHIVKARGMSHSNQVREYSMTDAGMVMIEPYVGSAGVVTGAARMVQEARDLTEAERRVQDIARRRREADRRRALVESQIADLGAALTSEQEEQQMLIAEAEAHEADLARGRAAITARRGAAR